VTNGKLKIIPLGGLGEIGRNMLVFEYEDDLIIVDAGLMFPENDMLGIDLVIPDMTYVAERADRVRAIIITHGHEDHIGALSYLLAKVQAPIYTTLLTRGLIDVKLRDSRVRAAEMHTIAAGDKLEIGVFGIEFFHVSHSIPDCVGLAIDTPIGLVVHSGDFKFDHSPVDGQLTDFGKLAEFGRRGTLLLMSDSTNAESPGYTPSEQYIGESIERVISEAPGRVIVATFASNISRVQQIADISQKFGRKVAVVGRSMVNNARIARELGYLTIPDDVMMSIEAVSELPDDQITLICTGSQGEPTSALVRMGKGEFRSVQLKQGDTVIVSATPIPGNEEFVNRTLDNLFRKGANVIYDEVLDVHVSGHASQEEQKMMINLVQPKFFVPIHGEYRHLVWHAKLARQCGVDPSRVVVMETGDVLELSEDSAEIVDHVADGHVFVDGRGVGDLDQEIIADRGALARSGFIVAIVAVDKYTNGLLGEPRIVTRGFIDEAESADLLEEAKQEIQTVVERGGTRNELRDNIETAMERFAYRTTGRRPVVIPVVQKL
jgi:ribonuclease J